jgi:hypothetical protein
MLWQHLDWGTMFTAGGDPRQRNGCGSPAHAGLFSAQLCFGLSSVRWAFFIEATQYIGDTSDSVVVQICSKLAGIGSTIHFRCCGPSSTQLALGAAG